MAVLRYCLIALVALILPAPALILAGASWTLAIGFGALGLLASTVAVLMPWPSLGVLAAFLAVVLGLNVLGAVLAVRAARQSRGSPGRWFRRWYALPLWIALMLGLDPTMWFGAASQSFSIPSGSMVPTLQVGDVVLADAVRRPTAAQIRRGDIVIFHRSATDDDAWIKRVVGLPGDRVQMRGGRLHVNGQPLRRDLVGPYAVAGAGPRTAARRYRETLPATGGGPGATYEIVEASDDGPFDNTREFRVPDGHLFVMGDNRDDSFDSRAPSGIGFVAVPQVMAKATFILWSDTLGRIGTAVNRP